MDGGYISKSVIRGKLSCWWIVDEWNILGGKNKALSYPELYHL